MELSASTVGALVVVAIVAAAAALAVAVAALQGQRRVRDAYRKFSLGSDDDVLTMLQRHVDEVRALRREIGAHREYADTLRALIAVGLSRVATVRYDAFDDMGGRMSFSTALLDEHGDGVVLTSINGRVETRTYAKPIVGGDSEHNLSGEERQAISGAREHRPRAALAKPPRVTPAYEGVPERPEADDDPGPAVTTILSGPERDAGEDPDDPDGEGPGLTPALRRPHPYDELARMDEEDAARDDGAEPVPEGATRADATAVDDPDDPDDPDDHEQAASSAPPANPRPEPATRRPEPAAARPRTARPRPSSRRPGQESP